MEPVYYYVFHSSNTISSGDIKCYVGFQNFTYEPLEHCDRIDRKRFSLISPYQTRNNLDYLQIEILKVTP